MSQPLEDAAAEEHGQFGKLLGLADSAYAVSTHFKAFPSLQFFGSGWGDMTKIEEFRQSFDVWQRDYQLKSYVPEVTLGVKNGTLSGFEQHGTFHGVLSHYLDSANRSCNFELLTPAVGPIWACVIILPGTGDQTFLFRKHAIAASLVKEGVACILPMPPFYGSRRPKDQWFHYITTFSDFVLQSGGLISECMQLLDWANHQFDGAVLGVSGLSWGGAMTACLGFLARKHSLAIVPCLPSASAQILVTGALRNEVALGKLANELGEDPTVAERRLLEEMAKTNLKESHDVAASFTGPTGIKAVCQVSAMHDAFVPPKDGIEAFSILRWLDSRARLEWIPGGHASAFAAARWLFPDRILNTLSRISSGHLQPLRSRL